MGRPFGLGSREEGGGGGGILGLSDLEYSFNCPTKLLNCSRRSVCPSSERRVRSGLYLWRRGGRLVGLCLGQRLDGGGGSYGAEFFLGGRDVNY